MKLIRLLLLLALVQNTVSAQILDKIKKSVGSNTTASNNNGTYQPGEVVEIWDPIEKGWFPSSILKAQDGKYFIHFTNYDPKWDTWVTAERIRQAGVGNKKDPGPMETGTVNGSNTNNVNNNAVAASTNPGPAGLPVINWKDKSLVFRIGDPVIYDYKGQKTVFTIANIDYNGTYKGIKCYNYFDPKDIDLNKVELVNGYNYHHYPADAVDGSGNTFKEGDRVEVLSRYDQFSKYQWVKGVVVSVDGDNYYVYHPGTTRNAEEEYFWHYVNDVRPIGSSKTTNIPPDYGRENTNPNKDIYLKSLKDASCEGGGDWHFMWFYRHDLNNFNGYDPVVAFNPGNFKKMMEGYDCMYEIRKNFPDIGISGPEIANRYDVQWEFLQNRKTYINAGLQRKALSSFNTFLLEVKDGKYDLELAKIKGLDDLKKKIKDLNKTYEEAATLLGTSINYPWDQLDKAYAEGLEKFNKDICIEYQGLKYDEGNYSAKDAKVEAAAIKYVQSIFPGSKILASGTSGDFYINKNSIGIPSNRAKGVVVIHQNPAYRTCISTYCFFQEDYAGGGVYNAGSINDQHTGNHFLKSCK